MKMKTNRGKSKRQEKVGVGGGWAAGGGAPGDPAPDSVRLSASQYYKSKARYVPGPVAGQRMSNQKKPLAPIGAAGNEMEVLGGSLWSKELPGKHGVFPPPKAGALAPSELPETKAKPHGYVPSMHSNHSNSNRRVQRIALSTSYFLLSTFYFLLSTSSG